MKHIIAFLTDFGNKDGYIAQLKGTLLKYSEEFSFIDISNEIKPYNINEGKFVLYNSYRVFPEGTIFFVVVDPGVGTERKITFIKSQGYYFLGPDNGIFDWACSQGESSVHTIDDNTFSTFQARDIMAKFLGEYLTTGPELLFISRAFQPFHIIRDVDELYDYKIIYKDRFGNLITNISSQLEISELIFNDRTLYTINDYTEKDEKYRLIKGSHGFWEICGY